MTLDRIKFCALAAAVAATFTGEAFAQAGGSAAPAVQTPAPAATQPSAAKGLSGQAAGTTGTAATGGTVTGGVPAMSGVTPNRAELAGSAFTKLDGARRGYLTIEDVRQLEGFESAFRQADQNGDGRLNPSEFNAAWSAFTGNTR